VAGLTKAKLEVYKAIFEMGILAFNKLMQLVLAVFAMYWFSRSFEKYIMSNTQLESAKWGAANVTFVAMIFAVYAYFFKKEDKEKKEGTKLDKLFDVALSRISGNNPPTPPSTP
jgi:hypothetical protein